jgi:hypothetical protein
LFDVERKVDHSLLDSISKNLEAVRGKVMFQMLISSAPQNIYSFGIYYLTHHLEQGHHKGKEDVVYSSMEERELLESSSFRGPGITLAVRDETY